MYKSNKKVKNESKTMYKIWDIVLHPQIAFVDKHPSYNPPAPPQWVKGYKWCGTPQWLDNYQLLPTP
jgi:hypothetical protein